MCWKKKEEEDIDFSKLFIFLIIIAAIVWACSLIPQEVTKRIKKRKNERKIISSNL